MKLPEGWQKADRPWEEYPIGTKARQSWEGGYWTKTEQGWKWHNGSTFPRPGAADQVMLAAAPTPPAQSAHYKPDDTEIRAIALRCGFRLKPQIDGTEDLNSYVYHFARELLAATPPAPAVDRVDLSMLRQTIEEAVEMLEWYHEERIANALQAALDDLK